MTNRPTSPLLVRRATRADSESLGRLGALLVREHHEYDARRFLPSTANTADMYAAFLAEQLDDRHGTLLVAEQDGRVVGYAYAVIEGYDYLALRGPAAVLHDLIVAPEYRNRGVGGALLNAMLSALTSDHVPRVVLSTAERNASAQQFFERAGFRRTMVEMTRELE